MKSEQGSASKDQILDVIRRKRLKWYGPKVTYAQHMVNMCSHVISDVFCTKKKCSHDLPWQIKIIFCKKILKYSAMTTQLN